MNIRTTLAAAARRRRPAHRCRLRRARAARKPSAPTSTTRAITTSVKARFVENKEVDASAISVETLNGTVMLSGFAKNATEKATAETSP